MDWKMEWSMEWTMEWNIGRQNSAISFVNEMAGSVSQPIGIQAMISRHLC